MKARVAACGGAKIFFMLHSAVGSIQLTRPESAGRPRGGGTRRETGSPAMCCQVQGYVERGVGFRSANRWRCAIRKNSREEAVWGAGRGRGNEFSVQHTTRRCRLHSCVERRDAQFSDVTLHPNISLPEADMDWMEMDDFQVYITFLYVDEVLL